MAVTRPNDTTVFTVRHHFVTERGDNVFVDKARATAVVVSPGLFAAASYPVRITGVTGQFEGRRGASTTSARSISTGA